MYVSICLLQYRKLKLLKIVFMITMYILSVAYQVFFGGLLQQILLSALFFFQNISIFFRKHFGRGG